MLGDAGPLREPDRSSARNDGRARAVAAGELPDPEDDARAYLEAEPGKLRVFRCPDCEVRVAQEADLCRRPSLARGVLAATFTRTFNMVQVEGSVCCCRCGVGLFPFDAKDPALLTLPLYWGGKRVFKKTALRLTVVQDMASSPIFDDEYRKGKPADPEVLQKHKVLVEMIPPMYPDRDVVVTHVVRYDVFADDGDWKKISDVDYFRALYREAGTTFLLVPEPETAETFRTMATQDFALMLHCQDDYRMFLAWTDFNAAYLEPCLMSLWLLTGGNVLFGDWGRPEATQMKQGPPDLEYLARAFERHERGSTNNQHAFVQLVRDGHYLGYWSSSDERPPQLVY
jgi:hypothetical protein